MLFLTVNSIQEAAANLHLTSIQGLELRLDRFPTIDLTEIQNLQISSPLPLLFTLRKVSQGGEFQGEEKERVVLIERLLHLQPAFFDLEYDTPASFLEKIAKNHPKTRLILSYHNFEKMVDLDKLFEQIQSPHVFAYKIACRTSSSLEALQMCTIVKKKNLCAIGMGKAGEITRVLTPITGNLMNFACSQEDSTPAGQLSAHTLQQVYNYSHLTRQTSLFALLGDPVEMSPSHKTHNQVFKTLGLDALYVKIPLKSSELSTFFSEMHALPFCGFSVTMPHKESIVPLMDELTEEAQAIGAVNTVLVKENKLYGTNTDGVGALDAIEERAPVQGKKILLLGAGGTARAIAFEAKKRGAKLTILNRTKERAIALGNKLNCAAGGLDEIAQHADYEILINATSVGMQEEATPIDPKWLLPRTLVLDVVMQGTPLLQAAARHGCLCVSGKELFIYQALRQFAFWFPEIDLNLVCATLRRYV